MSKPGSVQAIFKELHDEPDESNIADDGPEARLLSLLSETQSTLTVEPAGRVVYIDLTKSFFRGSACGRWFDYLVQQKLFAIACAYWISSLLFLALPFCKSSSDVTLLLTCVQIATAVPALLCSVASLNRDIGRLLLSEYEFRFVTLVNAIHWSATAAAFGDIRALCCVPVWLAAQVTLMIDADVRSLEAALKSSVIVATTVLVLLAYSFADALGESHSSRMTLGTRQLTIHDILLTTAPTLALFLVKDVYHQYGRLHARQRLPGTNTMYCSVYQKRLALQRVLPKGYRRRAQISSNLVAHQGIPLLRSHCVMSHVNTKNTALLAPRRFAALKPFALWLVLLGTLGVWGCLAMAYDAIAAQVHRADPSAPYHGAVAYTALAATVLYCSVTASMFQLDLVLALARTFDVMFSSLQFSVASVCLCDMMRWDYRCVNVLTWWLWFHWVLFIDALTPPVRSLLWFKKFPLSGVVLLTVYAYVTLLVLLYHYESFTQLHDRAWVAAPASVPPRASRLPLVRTESVLVGRLATLVFWNARLLWDLGVREDAELVFLRDLVEYYTPSESCAQLLGLVPRRLLFRNAVAAAPARTELSSRMDNEPPVSQPHASAPPAAIKSDEMRSAVAFSRKPSTEVTALTARIDEATHSSEEDQ